MTSGEGKIRESLVRADVVDCIVALPAQLFYTTGIPVCLWFLDRNKASSGERDRRGETLFIDARQMGSKISRTQIELTDEEIERIASTYHAWRGTDAGEYADEPASAGARRSMRSRPPGSRSRPAATSARPSPRRTRSRSRSGWRRSSTGSPRRWPRTSGWRGRSRQRSQGSGMRSEDCRAARRQVDASSDVDRPYAAGSASSRTYRRQPDATCSRVDGVPSVGGLNIGRDVGYCDGEFEEHPIL